MNRSDHLRFLESAIRSQQMAQKFHIGLAVGVVILGIVAIAVAQTQSGILIPENIKWLVTLGGTFVSSLSTIPVKQISDRRSKIAALQFLLDGFSKTGGAADDISDEEEGHLTDRFWKLMDATLGT